MIESFLYTIGYCHLRKGERLFRLDRITQLEMTSDPFPPRVNFPALEEIQRALAHVKREWHVEVWLETTLEEAQRQTRLPKAFFEESNTGVLLRMDVGDLPWMARLLAGLGTPFLIHHPPELREVVHQYALTLAGYARPLDE